MAHRSPRIPAPALRFVIVWSGTKRWVLGPAALRYSRMNEVWIFEVL